MAKNTDLMEYLVEKAGGEKAVMLDFYGTKLKDLIISGSSFGQIVAVAKKEKWYSVLATMSIAEALGMKTTKKTPKKATTGSARLTTKDKEQMVHGILDYLSKNPWSGKKAIVAAIGLDGTKVGVQIRALKKDGKIKSSGERAQMVHALISEETMAPSKSMDEKTKSPLKGEESQA